MSRVLATGNCFPHPDTPCDWISDILISVVDDGDALSIFYHVIGDIERMRLPEDASTDRRDDLWETTCFEAFLSFGDAGYGEYNFAPLGDWAAYRFSAYREGKSPWDIAAPDISAEGNEDMLLITARIEKPDVPDFRLGIAAVIEDEDGVKSYWALRHGAGQPDFHHADCFALSVKAPLAS